MKTQINNLQRGHGRQGIVGSSYEVRNEIAEKVLAENPECIYLHVCDEEKQISHYYSLHLNKSQSGKSWSYSSEPLSADEVRDILPFDTKAIEHPELVKVHFFLNQDMTCEYCTFRRTRETQTFKQGQTIEVPEANVTILDEEEFKNWLDAMAEGLQNGDKEAADELGLDYDVLFDYANHPDEYKLYDLKCHFDLADVDDGKVKNVLKGMCKRIRDARKVSDHEPFEIADDYIYGLKMLAKSKNGVTMELVCGIVADFMNNVTDGDPFAYEKAIHTFKNSIELDDAQECMVRNTLFNLELLANNVDDEEGLKGIVGMEANILFWSVAGDWEIIIKRTLGDRPGYKSEINEN